MRQPISAAIILTLWERSYGQGPVRQALALLSLALPEFAPARLVLVSIGARDRELMNLRVELFGDQVQSLVDCPACHDRVDLGFSISDLLAATAVTATSNFDTLRLNHEGKGWQLRLLNTGDLLAVESVSDPAARRQTLVRRCLEPVERTDEIADQIVSETLVTEAALRLADADPQADIRLETECPACRHTWSAPFDIVRFLWAEIDAWARGMMHEIHLLASSYGWSELEILNLSAWRRNVYLEMVRR